MATKKKDDELSILVVTAGVFSLALLFLCVTYKNISGMFSGGSWAGIAASVLIAIIIVLWVVVLKYWQDPNKDFLRTALFIFLCLALLVVGGHRAGWMEREQVIKDSRINEAQP